MITSTTDTKVSTRTAGVSSQELAAIKQQLKNSRSLKAPKGKPNRSDTVLNTYYIR